MGDCGFVNLIRMRVLVGAAILVVGGCASSDGSAATTAPTTTLVPSTTAASETTVPPTTGATTPATTPATIPATTPPTTPATTPPATSAVIGQCATAALGLAIGDSEGAAGSAFTPLVFTNNGSTTCTLDGHPGVSFIDGAGNQIGPSAERTDVATPTIALAPGEQAHATLQTHDAGFYDACDPVHAARMKVFPPDQTEAIIIDYPFDVCTAVISATQFTIGVVEPGTSD